MGISNVFILLSAVILGYKYAIAVLVIKTVLGSLFAGNISAVMYSLPAGAFALTLELLLLYFCKNVSVIAVSVLGAVVNSSVQNLVFCLVTGTAEYLAFLPYLSLIGIISGIIVGFTVYLIVKKLPLSDSGQGEITENE